MITPEEIVTRLRRQAEAGKYPPNPSKRDRELACEALGCRMGQLIAAERIVWPEPLCNIEKGDVRKMVVSRLLEWIDHPPEPESVKSMALLIELMDLKTVAPPVRSVRAA